MSTCIRSPATLTFHPVCHRTLSYTVLRYTGGPCWLLILNTVVCFPGGSNGKESTCDVGDSGLITGLGRSPGEGKGYPVQYSGLESAKGYPVQYSGLESAKGYPVQYSGLESATSGGACELQSIGSQRVRHNWETDTRTQTYLLIHSTTRWFLNTYHLPQYTWSYRGCKDDSDSNIAPRSCKPYPAGAE